MNFAIKNQPVNYLIQVMLITTLITNASAATSCEIEDARYQAVQWLINHQNQSTGEIKGGYIWDTCFGAIALATYGERAAALKAVEYIKAQQNTSNAGFGFSPSFPTPEATGPCYYAVMAAGGSIKDVTQADETPWDYLSSTTAMNGGFSSLWGGENIQDTAWGALGLAGAQETILPQNNHKDALDYITSTQNASGAWVYFSPTYDTASALLALHALGVSGSDQFVTDGLTYLINQQDANGSFGSQFHTALAALVLQAYGDNEKSDDAIDYLVDTMSEGGCSGSSEPVGSATAVCALALGNQQFGQPIPQQMVGVVVELPNETITECMLTSPATSGRQILETINGLTTNWTKYSFGDLLDCINGLCGDGGLNFWNFNLQEEDGWQSPPIGLSANNTCWNGNYSSWDGHYCAIDGQVLGLTYGVWGTTPSNTYTLTKTEDGCIIEENAGVGGLTDEAFQFNTGWNLISLPLDVS